MLHRKCDSLIISIKHSGSGALLVKTNLDQVEHVQALAGNIICRLLTKCEVKMAGYCPSSFLAVYGLRRS